MAQAEGRGRGRGQLGQCSRTRAAPWQYRPRDSTDRPFARWLLAETYFRSVAVRGFPTVRWVSGGSTVDYKGPRKSMDMISFAQQQHTISVLKGKVGEAVQGVKAVGKLAMSKVLGRQQQPVQQQPRLQQVHSLSESSSVWDSAMRRGDGAKSNRMYPSRIRSTGKGGGKASEIWRQQVEASPPYIVIGLGSHVGAAAVSSS